MKKVLLTLLLGSFMTLNLFAQQKGNFRERVKTLKKIKMIEYLDLEESKANQLMLKFNSLEGQMDDANESLKEAIKELEEAVEDEKSSSILKDLSLDVKQKTEDLLNLQVAKLDEIDKILNDDEFAKFLVFEKNFREELRERIAGRKGDRKGRR